MPHRTNTWLSEPVIPSPPALPRLDGAAYASVASSGPSPKHDPAAGPYPSGTWRVGTRAEDCDNDERFATSDSEAPTVRPGALQQRKRR